MYYKTKIPKQSNENTPYATRPKALKRDKNDQKKSQKHKTIHSTIQYIDSYKSLHSTVPKTHTNRKTITTT